MSVVLELNMLREKETIFSLFLPYWILFVPPGLVPALVKAQILPVGLNCF